MARRSLELPLPGAKSARGRDSSLPPGAGERPAGGLNGELIPTGCTLLNLALADDPYGGYRKGSLVNIVGDSSSGKTFLGWTLFAEMAQNEAFDNYSLHYDDVEGKFVVDVPKLFGSGTLERVTMEASGTIEDFDRRIRELFKVGRSFAYVLDSFDALSDREEMAKDELKRDYPAKPRLASEMFRKICRDLRGQESLIIVISQTRDKIGVTFGEKKTRSGGKALGFYSMHELWLAVKAHERRKDMEIGIHGVCKVKKNHLTGKLRTFDFFLYYDYGVDDVGSCIDWLVQWGFWKKGKGESRIDTGGDFGVMTREKLILDIESSDGKRRKLPVVMVDSWRQLEDSIKTGRKPRYE